MCINMKIYAKHDMAHKICSKIGNKQYNQKLQTPRESYFFENLRLFGLGRQIGPKLFGEFWVLLAKLSAATLVQ